eukprot:sb/3463714/
MKGGEDDKEEGVKGDGEEEGLERMADSGSQEKRGKKKKGKKTNRKALSDISDQSSASEDLPKTKSKQKKGKARRKKKGLSEDEISENSDDSSPVKKKKTKKKGETKEADHSPKTKENDHSLVLESDSDDELLKEIENMHCGDNKSVQPKSVVSGGSDSDDSVGLPDDMHVVRKGEEQPKQPKKKKLKDHDPEEWANQEWIAKEYSEGGVEGGEKKKKGSKKKKEDGLDAVSALVAERQRMVRESAVSLPRHEPAPLQLSDCLVKVPKLSAPLRPKAHQIEPKKEVFRPTLSSKNDKFFMPTNLGNFVDRLQKHMSLDSGKGVDERSTGGNTPKSVFLKKQLQEKLKMQMLTKKLEARKQAEENTPDSPPPVIKDPKKDLEELERILSLEGNSEGEESEARETGDEGSGEEEEEEREKVDKYERRAEALLNDEEVSSSSGQNDENDDTDSDLLVSADEVHIRELPVDSGAEDVEDPLQPSRYSLRRMTRKRRLQAPKKKKSAAQFSDSEEDKEKEDERKGRVEKVKEKMKRKYWSLIG